MIVPRHTKPASTREQGRSLLGIRTPIAGYMSLLVWRTLNQPLAARPRLPHLATTPPAKGSTPLPLSQLGRLQQHRHTTSTSKKSSRTCKPTTTAIMTAGAGSKVGISAKNACALCPSISSNADSVTCGLVTAVDGTGFDFCAKGRMDGRSRGGGAGTGRDGRGVLWSSMGCFGHAKESFGGWERGRKSMVEKKKKGDSDFTRIR